MTTNPWLFLSFFRIFLENIFFEQKYLGKVSCRQPISWDCVVHSFRGKSMEKAYLGAMDYIWKVNFTLKYCKIFIYFYGKIKINFIWMKDRNWKKILLDDSTELKTNYLHHSSLPRWFSKSKLRDLIFKELLIIKKYFK